MAGPGPASASIRGSWGRPEPHLLDIAVLDVKNRDLGTLGCGRPTPVEAGRPMSLTGKLADDHCQVAIAQPTVDSDSDVRRQPETPSPSHWTSSHGDLRLQLEVQLELEVARAGRPLAGRALPVPVPVPVGA